MQTLLIILFTYSLFITIVFLFFAIKTAKSFNLGRQYEKYLSSKNTKK